MSADHWRHVWPPFRIKLIDETARCLADQQALAYAGEYQPWSDLPLAQREALVEFVAGVLFAQDLAMQNLIARGEMV